MALGNVRTRALALALCVGSCGVSGGEATTLDRAAAPGGDLRLRAEGEHCAVQAGAGEPLVLSLPAPCMFVRKPGASDPQNYDYSEVGRVYLVVGALEASAPEGTCGTAAQSVIVRAGKLIAGEVDDTPNAHCVGSKTDEKLFYGLSHP